jgi:hypothetical protein
MRNTLIVTCVAGLALSAVAGRGDAPAREKDAAPRRAQLAANVFFEKAGDARRVIVASTVCLREGQLEGLLCRARTKEHEYILAADVDARAVHAGLIAAGAKPGNPVTFIPKYAPANGTRIKVTLQYEKDGKRQVVGGGDWIEESKTKKPLGGAWVFGGSRFLPDPEDPKKPPYYLANQGDLICVCNMESAMLDLPVASPKKLDERRFAARTDRIPPTGTKVEVILEPIVGK